MLRMFFLCAVALVSLAPVAWGRTWTDSTGRFTFDGDLIAFSSDKVILKKTDHEVVAVPINKLSKADQEFLKSKEAAQTTDPISGKAHTWTMKTGMKIVGTVLQYARKDVTVQRRRGKIYVNDRLYDNYNDIQRNMLPKIISYFDKVEIQDRQDLDAWMLKQGGKPRTFTCEGVLMELQNGDEYGIPFFLFSAEDRKVLEPGWQQWLAAEKDEKRQEEQSFLLQSQAQAYQQDHQASQQIAMMQLEMTAYAGGLFDYWQVRLVPARGAGMPQCVVVPARDSMTAMQTALQRYPGYTAVAASKMQRK